MNEHENPEMSQVPEAMWRKSSYSANGADCVEMADIGDAIAVRDSKDPAGPQLSFTRREWTAFLSGAKAGEFDLP